jgi:hypothetical protein
VRLPATAEPPYDWDWLVQEDRVHRLLYTDPAIFRDEMTRIFGAVWVYLAHASQIPRNDDFITTRLGLRPIILLRDSHGTIRALYNRTIAAAPSAVSIAAPRKPSSALTTAGPSSTPAS